MSFVRHDNAIVWKAQKQCISWLQNAGKLPARFVRFLVSVDSSWRFPRLSYNTVVSVFTIKWVIDRDGRELVLFLVKRGIINSEFSKGVFFVFVQHISRKGSPLMKNTSNVKVFQEVDNVRWSVNPILSWKCLFSPRTSEKTYQVLVSSCLCGLLSFEMAFSYLLQRLVYSYQLSVEKILFRLSAGAEKNNNSFWRRDRISLTKILCRFRSLWTKRISSTI